MIKRVILSDKEEAEFEQFTRKLYVSDDGKVNTYPEYREALSKWTKDIRKKYNLEDGESFSFNLCSQ